MKILKILNFALCTLVASVVWADHETDTPVVSDISYVQRVDGNGSLTKMVDIEYTLEGNRTMFVEFFFSPDGGESFPVTCTAIMGDAGAGVEPSEDLTQLGPNGIPMINFERKQATWDASVDWDQNFTDRGRIMVKATYGDQPTGFPGLDTNGSGFGHENPAPIHIVPSADNLEMIWVEPGTFMMGQVGVAEPAHEVTLTEGFYLGKFEVTQDQYQMVMANNADGLSTTPSGFGRYPSYPVEQVSWDDVQVFLSRLNNLETANMPAGWAYVLPTEAQWEYACRAGTTTDYSWGDDINASQANYNNNNSRPLNVGQYAPNPWGFFDMHGNVFEWTADGYGAYLTANPVVDPIASGSDRVSRGGSWSYGGAALRSATRYDNTPSTRSNDLGFRVGFQKQ
jgi:formylglycine-generating enzyme required for sulfatase activity